MVARDNFTFSELEQWLNERRVTEIECLVPDLTGVARGKILPREKFTEDRGMRLPEVVVAMGVTGEFPEEGPVLRRHHADRPRHAPAARPEHGAHRAVGDRPDRAGDPRLLRPRRQSRAVSRRARCCGASASCTTAEGWDPVVAPELEFYLVARNTDPDMPLKPPIGRSGRAETSRQAYSIDAVNEFDPLFEDVYDYCEKMELNVDTLIHEVGAGQMEINFFHAAPARRWPTRCSSSSARCARRRCGTTCTPPSWPSRSPASRAARCTCTRASSSKATGRNLFSNEDGTPSRGVLLVHRRPAEATSRRRWRCSRRTSTRYRRLARFTAAPINIQWGTDNRTVGIRSPVATPAGAAHREPRDRRRRQPLRRAGRHAGLRLPRHRRTASSRRPSARATPTWATTSCRAAWAKRCRCCATRRTCRGARQGVRHRLHRDQGDRARGIHEGDLAVGARAPAAARLRIAIGRLAA